MVKDRGPNGRLTPMPYDSARSGPTGHTFAIRRGYSNYSGRDAGRGSLHALGGCGQGQWGPPLRHLDGERRCTWQEEESGMLILRRTPGSSS